MSSSRSKQKGTGGEREVKDYLAGRGLNVTRTPAGWAYDLRVSGGPKKPVLQALATRPDKGEWLVTISLDDFARLLVFTHWAAAVEVKRYARFSLHSIWASKFGGDYGAAKAT